MTRAVCVCSAVLDSMLSNQIPFYGQGAMKYAKDEYFIALGFVCYSIVAVLKNPNDFGAALVSVS